jgi:hypothetical protein
LTGQFYFYLNQQPSRQHAINGKQHATAADVHRFAATEHLDVYNPIANITLDEKAPWGAPFWWSFVACEDTCLCGVSWIYAWTTCTDICPQTIHSFLHWTGRGLNGIVDRGVELVNQNVGDYRLSTIACNG